MENFDEKTEKSSLPVVPIDGSKIKTIREAKKLTQLYVANVVGVTTDTISRWENNGYPAIKRDNAEKLAAALEVDLAEIVKSEEQKDDTGEAALPPQPAGHRRAWVLACAAVLMLVAVFFLYRQLFAIPRAERNLPTFGAPGETIPVQIRVERKDTEPTGLIVKERLPAGWRFVGSLPQSAGNAGAGEVKWLIPASKGPVTISYTVQIPPDAVLKSTAQFTGEIVCRVGSRIERVYS